ncbi:uncharacterized protein LOC123542655 [Mercenaria mercenaria]|uniref:uncharacterized protein LOC123542655 n=1 Tax=Mercenaria mercenaria TaxID=6596 RepID=UPI00234F5A3E|nr:uncharacterized protein LOC123542655 [Mercenaria mercenaria]
MELKPFIIFSLTVCLLGILKECESVNPCPYGSPKAGAYCGLGGQPCPQYYSCKIAPNDAYAVCCPNYCKSGEPELDSNRNPIHCGRGGMRCSPSYSCHVAPTDAWAVCCPNVK